MKKKLLCCFLCIGSMVSILLLGGCKKKTEPITRTSFQLNTVVTVTLYDSEDEGLLDGAMELCAHYEDLFSRTKETSEIYRVNHGELEEVSEETANLLNCALGFSHISEGAFDPSIGAVSCLWDFHAENPSLPRAEELEKALPLVDYRKVRLSGNRVSFEQEGMCLDLGAIAKGYIADRIKEYLTAHGVKSAMIDLGGNILCVGSRPDGEPFRIGVRQPFQKETTIDEIFTITDQSVVTSGIYERCFEIDGVLYHHLLDPFTGYPCENELASVTIISDSSAAGDGFSTACFLLGLEKGLALLNETENVHGIFITRDGEIIYSDGFLPSLRQ